MRKSKFTENQVIAILCEGEAGLPVAQVCSKHGISCATNYHWKSKYVGMPVMSSTVSRTRELRTAALRRSMKLNLQRKAKKRVITRERKPLGVSEMLNCV